MSKTYSIVAAALLLSLAVSPASAAEPDPVVVAGANASPSVAQTPGAAPVVIAASEATAEQVETFSGTAASLHTEDQCSVTDLSVSRSKPSIGATTTFLFYNTRNVCNDTLNASGSLEVPDSVFTGDPRTSRVLTLNIDLSASPSLVSGPPLVANISFIKKFPLPSSAINRSANNNVSDAMDENGVRRILKFQTIFTSVTAFMRANPLAAGQVTTLPAFNDETQASIFWDDSKNMTQVQ